MLWISGTRAPWRAPTATALSIAIITVVVCLTACAGGEPEASASQAARAGRSSPKIRRDVVELGLLKEQPRACDADADCPAGSHCDDATDQCDWSCLSDSECGDTGAVCTALGWCEAPVAGRAIGGPIANVADGTDACARVPAEIKRAALIALDASDDPPPCVDDDECTLCGSYCGGDGFCRVDCLPADPTPELTCDAGKVCNPLGRCVTAPSDPGPLPHLAIAMSPEIASANTIAQPILVPVTVNLDADSLVFVEANHPAVVSFRVLTDPVDPEDPAPEDGEAPARPRVTCTANGALADHCELSGGWQFDVVARRLRSAPRTIWVEIPRTATPKLWTLEARSDWTAVPAMIVVRATAVAFPDTESGSYRGTLTWPAAPGVPAALDVAQPVEAIVTADHVALFDPTRALFPDGHVVLPRDRDGGARATLVPWLTSTPSAGPAAYQVRLDLGALTYSTASGELTGALQLVTNGARTTTLALALDRTGDATAPSCAAGEGCAAGRHCDDRMRLCLPGAAGGGVIVDASAPSSITLASAQVEAWNAALAAMMQTRPAATPLLNGPGLNAFESAYCFRDAAQTLTGRFAGSAPEPWASTHIEPSRDLSCFLQPVSGAPTTFYPQPTFEYANRTTEVDGVTSFELLQKCTEDLSVQPTGPTTPANLLVPRPCASLARFYQALRSDPSAGFPLMEFDGMPHVEQTNTGLRFAGQLLRQWLGLQSYVARTTIQTRQHQDILPAVVTPAFQRLGEALDRAELNLQVMLDPSVRRQFTATAPELIANPDYRLVSRPAAYWTFADNAIPSANSEGGPAMTVTGAGVTVSGGRLKVSANAPPGAVCETAGPIALADTQFTIVLDGGFVIGGGPVTLLSKTGADGHRLAIEGTGTGGGLQLVIRESVNGTPSGAVTFPSIPVGFAVPTSGIIAIVADAGSYRVYQYLGQFPLFTMQIFSPTSITGQPRWGSPGKVRLACDAGTATMNTQFGTKFDHGELSLWSRALPPDEFLLMRGRVAFRIGPDMVPPRPALPLRGTEQSTGLAAHLLEAAGAHLELVSEYLDAERNVIYPDCSRDLASAARTRAVARAGRNLRLAAILEGEALQLANQPGVAQAPWFPRYQGDLLAFAARRRKVVDGLAAVTTCDNPLGIADEELPLFVGNAGAPIEKFFAGSRFLAAEADDEIRAAGEALGQARNAYNEQRITNFQVHLEPAEKNLRIARIGVDYEARLRRYCGTPPGDESPGPGGLPSHVLLDGFRSGALTAASCFFRTEVAFCQDLAGRPLAQVPSVCLRGEIGEHLLAIQAATTDAENAMASLNRAIAKYDAGMEYCGHRQERANEDNEILEAHHRHMRGLREMQRNLGLFFGFEKALSRLAGGDLMGGFTGLADIGIAAVEGAMDEAIEGEKAGYAEVVLKRRGEDGVLACYHEVDNEKFTIDAARDVIKRVRHDTEAAQFHLADAKNAVTALAAEASGQVALENSIERVPPHLHHWLSDHIDVFERRMARARRLTYLALRALEYESQQSLGKRGDVLNARLPDELAAVTGYIRDRNRPFEGGVGTVGPHMITLSLRDQILRIEDLAGNSFLDDGEAPATPTEALRAFLTSEASKVFSRSGVLLGHGVRFSLRPGMGFNINSCAERIWRVTPSVQIDGELTQHQLTLLQDNAFASQACFGAADETAVSRFRPSQSLFGGDGPGFAPPSSFTAMNIDGPTGRTREQLEAFPEGDFAGLAGRGLYGNYLLLFPTSPDGTQIYHLDALGRIKDVLLRFDTVEVTDVDL